MELLQEVLGNPCYTNSFGEVVEINTDDPLYKDLNIGACSSGLTARDSEENLICVGQIKPTEETCNNVDDNCNGYVDDRWAGIPISLSPSSSENECVGLGVCSYAMQVCVEGSWKCSYPLSYGEEICDGLDNDCDGETDEDTLDDPLFTDQERYVYTGDPDTINVGECRAGYKECIDGRPSIRNMVIPVPEICGNGDDDDCDGMTDEDEDDDNPTDFVFIIDFSGSMEYVTDQVANALCSWSSQGVLQSSRFAVVAIGLNDPFDTANNARQIKILTDFTDSNAACSAVRRYNTTSYQGHIEYQLDAIYESSLPGHPNYLSWSANNDRKVLVFSDEAIQQDIANTIIEAIEMIVVQCVEQNYTIGAFIDYNTFHENLWLDLTQRCGGFLDYLSTRPQEMIDTLNYWLGTEC
jgi:hypothetical protein